MKKAQTHQMFEKLAPKYDLLNHVLSLNNDRWWRRVLVQKAGIREGDTVLDVCAGTCDIPLAISAKHPQTSIVSADLSQEMLVLGKKKLERKGIDGHVHLIEADVLTLPFEGGTFDAVTIGFGLRNLSDYETGVAEMARVLKPGGRLLVLELAPPGRGVRWAPYRWYLKRIVPSVGGMISGMPGHYKYLSLSVDGFLSREAVCGLLDQVGLRNIVTWRLAGGICMLYRGEQ